MPRGIISNGLHEACATLGQGGCGPLAAPAGTPWCHPAGASPWHFLAAPRVRASSLRSLAATAFAEEHGGHDDHDHDDTHDLNEDDEGAVFIPKSVQKQPEVPRSGWENTEGLPRVSVESPSDAYISRDIADNPNEEGTAFKPTLGCKCGNWRPAPAHPEIEFRKPFLEAHPDFLGRVAKLQVHLADDAPPGRVHWDAAYDLRRFLDPADLLPKGAGVKLLESAPAIQQSGKQLRFLTFCPPEGGPAHDYTMKVTAYDQNDAPIEYFQDKVSKYRAEPPPPEASDEGGGAGMAAMQ